MTIYQFLFRFRRWALIVIFFIGFWAPFDRIGGARPGSTWLFLSGLLADCHLLPIAYSSIAVMAVAIVLAVISASLRTWATAYLGTSVMRDSELHGERIVADGPYRYVRNPLYVGLWLHTLALAILMPPGGAIFAVVAISVLIAAIVHAEERHLTAERGAAYAEYRRRVRRFLCAIRPRVPAGDGQANWGNGFLAEIYMWGAVVTYVAFASRYNVTILEQGILISLGISIVLRGALRPRVAARA